MLSRHHKRKLRVEQLEDKRLLAADMASEFLATIDDDGNLIIVNDVLRPDVSMRQDILLEVVGEGEAVISAAPLSGVRINGAEPGTLVPVSGFIGDVSVDFGESVEVAGSPATFALILGATELPGQAIPGDVSITGGNDLTGLFFLPSNDVVPITGDVRLTTTRGEASIVTLAPVDFGGDLLIDSSAADGGAEVISNLSQIAGDLLVNAGDGEVDFDAISSNISGDVVVTAGAGDADITVASAAASVGGIDVPTVIGGSFSFGNTSGAVAAEFLSSEVGADLLLDLGTGNNAVELVDFVIGNDARVDAVGGTNLITIGESTIANDIRVDAAGGFNLFEIEESSVGDDVGFFSTGAGIDSVTVEVSSVGDNLLVDVGDRNSSFDLVDEATVGGDVRLLGGGGANNYTLGGSAIGGALRIGAGGGADSVEFEELSVGDRTFISLGGGDSDVAELIRSDAGQSLVVVGSGTNEILLDDITATAFVGVYTASSDDVITFGGVRTGTAVISTGGGADSVTLQASEEADDPTGNEFDRLFLLLGGGDDTLEIGDTTIDRWAFLSGGSGDDELVDLGGNNFDDARFVIGVAFEEFTDASA